MNLLQARYLAEAETRIAATLVGKSDDAVRVYSKPGKTGIMVVEFSDGEEVEIQVRA